jgi:adenylate cyclase
MKTFEEALADARDGEGRAIAVVAEAGIGKSRLCLEFAERCRDEGLEVFEAQAQSHGKSIPYMPVLQMLRAYFGIGDREQERAAREKIAGRALLLDPDFAEDLPVLFDFLGVPDPERPVPALSADARKRALGRILGRLLHAPNRRHTVVILVEDLHWIDEASDEMLGMLIGSIEATNTLVLVNFRPEYSPPWARDGAYREIALEPLSEAATAELLADLAGDDPSLDGLEGLIHTRTQGNPFFIEEIVRELVESAYLEGERGAYRLARPVEDAGVPPTVQAILSSRIDRLSPEGKRLLQVAAVLGKEVEHRGLQIASGLDGEGMEPALCELTDNGFLYEAEIYPERVFAFRHPLTREVAYGSQLAEGRGATHVAAARALIELEADRHDELAALIADHLAEGGESLEAARWYARAAYWTGGSQPAEALRLWKEVTRLASDLEATGADTDGEAEAMGVGSRLLQLDYAWRLGMDPEEERQLAAEAEEVAQRTGDLRSLALLKMATEARPGLMHDTSTWIAAADEATRLAVESGDQHLEVAIRSAGAYARLCAGRFDDFDRELDRVLEVSGGDPTVGAGIVIGNPVAWAYMGKGTILRERGEYEEAERLLDSAIRVTAEADDPETESWIRGAQSMLRCMQDDIDGALAVARRNCELTERLGDVFSRSLAIASLAIAEIYAGEFAAALKSIDEAERLYRSAMGNGGEQETWRAATRIEALVGVGRVEEAIELGEWAAEEARGRGLLWSMPVVLLALGRARIAHGEDEAAREAFEAAGEVAAETGAAVSGRSAAEALEALGAGAR